MIQVATPLSCGSSVYTWYPHHVTGRSWATPTYRTWCTSRDLWIPKDSTYEAIAISWVVGVCSAREAKSYGPHLIGFVSQPPFWVAFIDPGSSTGRPCNARYRFTIYPSRGQLWDPVRTLGPSWISDYGRVVPIHSTFHISSWWTH